MSAAAVPITSPIYEDEHGTARIVGSNTPVKMVAVDHIVRGFSPVEIHFQYPYLSMAEIHAALSYYFAHREAIDAEVDRDEAQADAIFSGRPKSITRELLLRRLESSG